MYRFWMWHHLIRWHYITIDTTDWPRFTFNCSCGKSRTSSV